MKFKNIEVKESDGGLLLIVETFTRADESTIIIESKPLSLEELNYNLNNRLDSIESTQEIIESTLTITGEELEDKKNEALLIKTILDAHKKNKIA